MSAGSLHACAMWDNGGSYREANCWGNNRSAQTGANMASWPATSVIGAGPNLGGTPLRVATQNNFTCADQPSPSVQCFGDNYYGQLGNGVTSSLPTARTRSIPSKTVSAGPSLARRTASVSATSGGVGWGGEVACQCSAGRIVLAIEMEAGGAFSVWARGARVTIATGKVRRLDGNERRLVLVALRAWLDGSARRSWAIER